MKMEQIFARAVLYLKSASAGEGVLGGAALLSVHHCMSAIGPLGSL